MDHRTTEAPEQRTVTPAPHTWLHTRHGIEAARYTHISSTPDGFGDIATVWDAGAGSAQTNAELIVRAVNSRDALVAALEQIAIVCTQNMDRDRNHRMALDGVRQIANDALSGGNVSGEVNQ